MATETQTPLPLLSASRNCARNDYLHQNRQPGTKSFLCQSAPYDDSGEGQLQCLSSPYVENVRLQPNTVNRQQPLHLLSFFQMMRLFFLTNTYKSKHIGQVAMTERASVGETRKHRQHQKVSDTSNTNKSLLKVEDTNALFVVDLKNKSSAAEGRLTAFVSEKGLVPKSFRIFRFSTLSLLERVCQVFGRLESTNKTKSFHSSYLLASKSNQIEIYLWRLHRG